MTVFLFHCFNSEVFDSKKSNEVDFFGQAFEVLLRCYKMLSVFGYYGDCGHW